MALMLPMLGVSGHAGRCQLDEIADRLNGRPRKTLGFMTPSAKLSELLQ